MIQRHVDAIQLQQMKRLVWCELLKNGKVSYQWINPQFWDAWLHSMKETFETLGMEERLDDVLGKRYKNVKAIGGLVPVTGSLSKQLIRQLSESLEDLAAAFLVSDVEHGRVVQYRDSRKRALAEWRELADLIAKAAAATIVTDELRHYVAGTEDGYHPSTRAMFVPGNQVEKLGKPYEPYWKVNMAGHNINLYGNWDRIRKTRDETGLNIFHMLQFQINEQLEEMLKMGH